MKTYTYLSVIVLFAAATALCHAAEKSRAEQIAATITPLLDEQAVLVAHVDYTDLDADATVETIGKLLGKQANMAESAARPKSFAIQALKEAGAREAYYLISVADATRHPGMLIVPLPEDADPETIGTALEKIQGGPHYQVERIGSVIVSASSDTLARLKEVVPVARPHLVDAFDTVKDAPLKIVLTPPDYFRPVIEQTMPELPEVVGGGSSTILTAGAQWAAVGVEFEPQPKVRIVIQSESPEAATALANKLGEASKHLSKNEKARANLPKIDEILTLLTPDVENDQVLLTVGVENGKLPKLIELALPK
jgi:hypothetical protein